MTRANSLADLYSFEKYFEDVAITFLEADTGLDVFASASLESFVTPRIEISFKTLEAVLPVDAPIVNDLVEYRKHQANFDVTIVTDSSVGDPQTRQFHLEAIGKVRASLLRTASNWNSTNLPFYGVKFIRQSSMDRATDGDLELSILSYDIFFSIREDAFPTTSTTTTSTSTTTQP